MRKPTLVEWVGVAALATSAAALGLYLATDALDDWAPNAGTEAVSIFITVVIVGAIVQRAERTRVGPWIENAMQDLNFGVRSLLLDIAVDYLKTHRASPRPIPRDGRDLIDQWLADRDKEDTPRSDPRTTHTLLRSADLSAERFERDRSRHSAVLEPVIVAALDNFILSLRNASFIYDLAETMKWPLDRALRSTHRSVVEAVGDFITVFAKQPGADVALADYDMRVIHGADERLAEAEGR